MAQIETLPWEREYPPVIKQLAAFWRSTRRYPVLPIVILSMLLFAGITAPWISPHGPREGGVDNRHVPPAWYSQKIVDVKEGTNAFADRIPVNMGITEAAIKYGIDPTGLDNQKVIIEAFREAGWRVNVQFPTSNHLLGTDHAGRDVLTRVLYGARISLAVAVISLLSGFVGGTTLGLISGFAGGWVDEVITRFVDIWQALPFLMVALVAVMIFGQSVALLLVLMASLAWVTFVRIVRSQTLQIKNFAYVDLARVAGASYPRIIIRHIVPGVINTAVVVATLSVGNLILAEAALSFLGAGIPSPTPAWGIMVAEGRGYLSTAWWPTVFPGLCIFLVVLSLNFLGDWLRDRFDPRLRQVD